MGVSAIWHGFYPGYFYFFLMAGLMDYVSRLVGQCHYLFRTIPEGIWKPACFVWCYSNCAVFASSFLLLSLENSHKVNSALGYAFHVQMLVIILVFNFSGITQHSKRLEKLDSEKKIK